MNTHERAALEQVRQEMVDAVRFASEAAMNPKVSVEEAAWIMRLGRVAEKWSHSLASLLTPSSPEHGEACNAPTPDRSGRRCDKPRGHDGLHWTYGGNTMSWSAASPSVDGKEKE